VKKALIAVSAAIVSFAEAPITLFEDQSSRSGIDFVLQNSRTREKHQIETMAGGVAVFDYDNDGYPDIYFVNGAAQPALEKSSPSYYNRLYRNKGNGTFEDVTERAGVAGKGYNIGAAAGDFDNDGNVDLFVTGVNGNTLYRNRGNGTFEDVTRKAGLQSDLWSVSAAWFDYDNDGLLDLFVVNYVNWDPAQEPFCGDALSKSRTYCHPRFYEPLANRLYHNNGNGTFTDVSETSGIAAHRGKGMGVAIADYDHDGRMDIFVANDTVPNFLFHNEGNGRFREVAFEVGIALKDDATATSSMGADFRDLNNDGSEDLIVTALASETFPLFLNGGHGFRDMTYPSLVGSATLALSGWGVGIYDFDNDGWKDIFTANGDVQDNSESFSSRKSRQQNLLLLNDGEGRFRAHLIGTPAQHRGAAFGDFDRDGRVDVVLTRLNEPPVLLRNRMGAGNHWVGIKLIGTRSNRDALSARVVIRNGQTSQVNHVTTSVGYASSSDPTVHFGLGTKREIDQIEIEWPSGSRQTLTKVGADRYITVREP
jgi:enediyne biosynthesis protein E4